MRDYIFSCISLFYKQNILILFYLLRCFSSSSQLKIQTKLLKKFKRFLSSGQGESICFRRDTKNIQLHVLIV